MKQALASVLVVGLAIISTGCPGTGGDGGGGGGGGNGEANTFTATLAGDQETPPVTTDATGDGTFTLSDDGTEIDFEITASGLTGLVTAAHFHQGAEGVAGGIVIDIGADVSEVDGAVTVRGSAAADAAFVTALRAGNIYVNLHTDLNPAGEIRGQLEATPAEGGE